MFSSCNFFINPITACLSSSSYESICLLSEHIAFNYLSTQRASPYIFSLQNLIISSPWEFQTQFNKLSFNMSSLFRLSDFLPYPSLKEKYARIYSSHIEADWNALQDMYWLPICRENASASTPRVVCLMR
jgi:hypothetical protein